VNFKQPKPTTVPAFLQPLSPFCKNDPKKVKESKTFLNVSDPLSFLLKPLKPYYTTTTAIGFIYLKFYLNILKGLKALPASD
jgi:hypothetical protein